MITNEEARKAIEKYQKEHPLQFGTMLDVTAISSEEGADIISQTVEKISKKIEEDTDLWCICEMAKMYMQGVKPVYPVEKTGYWKEENNPNYSPFDPNTETVTYSCSNCGEKSAHSTNYCSHCGAKMGGEENEGI